MHVALGHRYGTNEHYVSGFSEMMLTMIYSSMIAFDFV